MKYFDLSKHKGEILKLDIGCGDNKETGEGWIGMDIRKFPGVDIVQDLEKQPWPFAKDTFTLLSAAHVIEHINPHHFGFIKFMDECWRILKPDGQFRISTPYGGSTRYLADPTHINPVVPHTFHYFDPLQITQLYKVYRPKPWAIRQLTYSQDGNIECLLSKRREDRSYLK
jgi:SAM-dependent methyltransferase